MYDFIIYTGGNTVYGNSRYPDEPITARVVLELAHSLLGQGYCLLLDNYYNSIDLSDKLAKERTDCMGTMRLNRKGIPQEVKSKKLAKGDLVAQFRKKQVILKWRDKTKTL